MKNILFFCESLGFGGAEKSLYTLLKHINKSLYNITVVCVSDGGYYSSLVRKIAGINYEYILSSHDSFFNRLKAFLIYRILPPRITYKLLVHHRFDTEIAFCEGFSTKVIGSTSNNVKKIAWVHTDLQNNDWPVDIGIFKSKKKEVECYNKFNNVVGVSKSVCDGLIKKKIKSNVNCIYNLIDKNDIILKANQEPVITLDKNEFNIVSIGRLEYVKGYDRLINAFAKLLENRMNSNIKLTIVGGGSELQNLKAITRDLKIEQFVNFTGAQENPYSILRQADLYVCPSRNEGFNIAIVEAFILGKPVVSTSCCGPEELLEHNKYGLLCENSEEGIRNLLDIVVNNKKLLMDLQQKSLERGKSFKMDYTLDRIMQLL